MLRLRCVHRREVRRSASSGEPARVGSPASLLREPPPGRQGTGRGGVSGLAHGPLRLRWCGDQRCGRREDCKVLPAVRRCPLAH
eukprot:10520267-Alexandrium_andersonii.AAC.1